MSSNIFEIQTATPADILNILTIEMMLHHLYISDKFRPQHLWKWVDRSQVGSKEYLFESYGKIFDSWTKFKCTGHGAIELGILRNIPSTLLEELNQMHLFGVESKVLSSKDVFLKMNIDEYIKLVSYFTMIVHNMPTLDYLTSLQVINVDKQHCSPILNKPVPLVCCTANVSAPFSSMNKTNKLSKLTVKFLSFKLFTICRYEETTTETT